MTITTTPHVNFDGQAAAALAFWGDGPRDRAGPRDVRAERRRGGPGLGGPGRLGPGVLGERRPRDGVRRVARTALRPGHEQSYVYLSGTDEDEIRAVWAGLQEGAEVRQPLGASAWSPLAGQLRDRFGVVWALDVPAQQG